MRHGGYDSARIIPMGDLSIRKAKAAVEEHLIRAALDETRGNRLRACELLEISARALLYKMRDYGIVDTWPIGKPRSGRRPISKG